MNAYRFSFVNVSIFLLIVMLFNALFGQSVAMSAESINSDSLVKNGSFETGKTDWSCYGEAEFVVDGKEFVEGAASLRLDGSGAGTATPTQETALAFDGYIAYSYGGAGTATLTQEIAVQPDTELLFTAHVKSEDRVVVTVGRRSLSYHMHGSWQKLSGLVRTGSNDTLTITFTIGGLIKRPDSTWIDKVALRRVQRREVPTRRVYPTTAIVEDGSQNAHIIYPSPSPELKKQAEKLSNAVRAKTGVAIPVKSDIEVTESDRPVIREPYRSQNLILIGRLGTNRAIWPAYNRFLCAVDGYYPGGEGYVVRTASNVMRNGKNHIILGGSNDQSAVIAVKRFLEIVQDTEYKHKSLVLPWLLDVKLAGDCLDAFKADDKRWGTSPLSPSLPRIQPGYGTVHRWYHNGMGYYWSGWPSYRRRALDMIEPVLKDRAYTHHYFVEFFVRTWDMLDDSGLYSSEQRRLVDDLIFTNFWQFMTGADLRRMTQFSEPYDNINLVNRHSIAPWMSDLKMAQFFHEYFDLEGEIKDLVEFRFTEKYQFFKHLVKERWGSSLPYLPDSENEEEIVASLFRFALDNDLYIFFEKNNARRALLLDKINHLNGILVYPSGRIDHPLTLGILSHYYRDERYKSLLNKPFASSRSSFMNRYINGVRRYTPSDKLKEDTDATLDAFTGVRVPEIMPHNLNHTYWLQGGRFRLTGIEPDRMFYFAAFRSGFNRNDDYIAFSGTNSLLCPPGTTLSFTSRGETWFDKGSSAIFSPSSTRYYDQNTVSVIPIDRWIDETQPYAVAARKNWTADFHRSGGISFTLDPFMQTRWQRQILWLRPGLFVFRDTVRALEDGEYQIAVTWKPYGYPAWDGSVWTSTRRASQLRITPLGPSFYVDQNIEEFRNIGNKVDFRQKATLRMAADEAVTATTVIQAMDRETEEKLNARLVSPESLIIQSDDRGEEKLILWGDDSFGNIDFEADAVILQPRRIQMINGTSLKIEDVQIINCETPVNVSLDFKNNKMIVDNNSIDTNVNISIAKEIGIYSGQVIAGKGVHELEIGKAPRVLQAIDNVFLAMINRTGKELKRAVVTARSEKPEDKTSEWEKVWSYDGLQKPARVGRVRKIGDDIYDLGKAVELVEIRAILAHNHRTWELASLPDDIWTALPTNDGRMPEVGSSTWEKVAAKPVWNIGVRTGNYGRADPVQSCQSVYPNTRARFVRARARAKSKINLYFYEAEKKAARCNLKLEQNDFDGDGAKELFILPDIWPLFIRPRQGVDEAWAVLKPDGTELANRESDRTLQVVRSLDVDNSGTDEIVEVSDDAQIKVFDFNGRLLKHIDLYGMHQRFNETEGRANTRQPAGLYTMPFAVGLWRPDANGRQKIVISRYHAISFVDAQDRFEGVLMAGGTVTPGLLPYGIDFNGDGKQEQVCLASGTVIHLDGDDTPTVRDPGGNVFYPEVYNHNQLVEPDSDRSRVILFESLPYGDTATARYLLVVRETYIGIYDGLKREWAFTWVPETRLLAAAIAEQGPDKLRVMAVTDDKLMWDLTWKSKLNKISSFSTFILPLKVSSIDVNDQREAVLCGQGSGLLLYDGKDKISAIAKGQFQDAAWLANGAETKKSVIAVTGDGEIIRFKRVLQ